MPQGCLVDGEVTIRCAHGDYPLSETKISIAGRELTVLAAVSDNLPISMLLGRDVPELMTLLGEEPSKPMPQLDNPTEPDVLTVTTRTQAARQERETEQVREHEEASDSHATSLNDTSAAEIEATDGDVPPFNFDNSETKPARTPMSKSERRTHNRCYTSAAVAGATREACHPLDITTDKLRQLQEQDMTLEAVRGAVRGECSTAGRGFFVRDGVVYRRYVPPGCGEEEAVDQLVLPTQCRGAVMKLAHSIPLAGHPGKTKTTRRIAQRFYWPSLYDDVASYCKACPSCQKTSPRRSPRAPLIPLPIVDGPFRRIAMDIVGPLPRSHSGEKYILVVCDYATRYPEAIPLRSIDAGTIAQELIQLSAGVGVPKEVLTDQGSNFTSQLLVELYRLLNVRPIHTSPYHPQTDGLVERFNQTLKAMLRKTATDEGKDWDKLLPYLLFAYREVPQASTGFSPFELLYGWQVRGPLDILKESWQEDRKSNESVVSYVLGVQEKLAKLSGLVRENLAAAQKQQKQWYDRNARERESQSGQRVLVLLPTSSNKLLAEWQGPYTILRCRGRVGSGCACQLHTSYEVDMHNRRKRKRIFHVNMLHEWHTQNADSFLADEVSDEGEDIVHWDGTEDDQPIINECLTSREMLDLQQLLRVFGDILRDQPGCTTITQHHIDTGSAQPIRLAPYRIPHAYRDTVKKELQEMEASGIIERSSSEWAAPIVLVRKKDGALRMCVDYRHLNAVSRADAYPIPRVDDLIDRLGKAKYITTLDLSRGYWQVPVDDESRSRTAFTTPFGSFGSCPSGSTEHPPRSSA